MPARRGSRLTDRPWWPHVRRWGSIGFLLLVGALLIKLAAGVDWRAAWTALRGLPASTLLMAAALAACSHAIVASYDLVGRHVTGHGLPRRKVVQVGFVSYAVNLNLGALVGGVAFRYRLYSRQGLDVPVITRVLALSILTNWLGYLLLAGALLVFAPPALPARWGVPSQVLPLLGGAMLAGAAGYLLLCAASRRREWVLRGHEIKLPGARVALLQLAMSSANWMVMAAVIAVLLQGRIEYPVVLGTLLLAAVAGVVAHVPAGLGVIEAVFVAMLAARLPQHELLAALLAYRGLYYLVPLGLASGLFFFVDRRGRKPAAGAADPAAKR